MDEHADSLKSEIIRFLAVFSINPFKRQAELWAHFKENNHNRRTVGICWNPGGYYHLDLTWQMALCQKTQQPHLMSKWLAASSSLSKQCAFWLQELWLHFGQHWLVVGGSGRAIVYSRLMIGYTWSNYCQAFCVAFDAYGKAGEPCG